MQGQDTRIFNGVMDQDSAPFTIDQSNVRYRLNLVNLYNDNGFASNENIQGFEMVANSYLSTGRNKCIGAFEDVRGNSIIYFVWAEDGTHGIYRWYQNKGGLNGQLEKIHQGSVLDFNEFKRISHCSLVDNLFAWTDGLTQPKCINISRLNLTNKRRVFNLYFDDTAFTSSTTYTITIYASVTVSITYSSSAADYAGRVSDFITAANSNLLFNQYAKIIDKVNYVQIELSEVGDYMIEATPSCYVIAENFYPDVTPTPYTYSSLSEELITTIKYPPFKAPSVKYSQVGDLGSFNVGLASAVINNVGSGGNTRQNYTWLGINDKTSNGFYDTGNFVSLGATTNQVAPPFFPLPSSAYVENSSSDFMIINFRLKISGHITYVNPTVTPYLYVSVCRYDITLSPNGTIADIPVFYGSFSYDRDWTIKVDPSEKYFILIHSYGCSFDISGTMSGNVSSINIYDITKRAYQFRAKYIYKDFQQSVLGAISAIPLPTNQYQNAIQVDFSDDRLSSQELVSDIDSVILCVTNDGGTTWYEFNKLTPYQFVGSGRQISYFTSQSYLLTIPPSEAVLPYHNIPLTAKSQEFIDDRLFYGAIKTGYDSIIGDFDITVNYEDLSNYNISNSISSVPPYSLSYWRRGWEGYIGIVYYDDADRRSAVILDQRQQKTVIKNYCQEISFANKTLSPAYLSFAIRNEPPSWATKYQFVRTQDLSASDYLIWVTNQVEYLADDDSVTTPTLATYIKISLSNIPYYSDTSNKGTKINFPFVNGDQIRFIIKSGTTNTFFENNSYEIVKVDGTDVYIKNDKTLTTNYLNTTTGGDLVEIFTPNINSDAKLYYEFGECLSIKEGVFYGIKKKYHSGDIVDQKINSFGNPPSPARGNLLNGNVFYRERVMPYRVNVSGGTKDTASFYISSNTISDYTATVSNNNGRVNSTELLGQVYQPTGVVFTNRYISGTKINGLNAVEAANTRQYSTIYGDLNKMQVVNNDVLKLIFGNGYQLSIYVNQGVIRQTGGASNLISIYDDVAGNSHLIQRTLGTQNAESVVLNDEGDVFGWDETEGVDWLSASNATLQVSDYNMKNTFGNYGLQRRRLDNTKSNAPAIYDLYRDLMILTLAPLQPRQFIAPKATVKLADLDDISKWTIEIQLSGSSWSFSPTSVNWYDIVRATIPNSYSMTQNADGSFDISSPYINETPILIFAHKLTTGRDYTYTYPFTGGQEASNEPPFSGVTLAYSRKLKGWVTYFSFLPEMYGRLRNQVASFKDGQLWLHDKSVLSNNFYGVQYPSLLRFVLNKDYPKVKVPLSVWYRGLGSWGSVVRYQPDNMETEMIPAAFRLQENGYAASVTRDRNDPRFTDPQQAWVNGQEVRGDAVEIELYNNDSSQARIDSEKTVYLHSNLS